MVGAASSSPSPNLDATGLYKGRAWVGFLLNLAGPWWTRSYLPFILTSSNTIYNRLSTTMLPWSAIITTLLGLPSAVVVPSDPGFYTLTQDKIDSTNLYAHYAAAVKCGPQTLIHWNCGRACLASVPFSFLQRESMRCDAR